MLAGQGEELADRRRAGLAEGLEQPLDHRAEHLVGLQVQRRAREPRVAAVEQGGTEVVQPADGPVEQGPDDRLGGGVAGQFVQVALDDGRGLFLTHGGPSAANDHRGRLYCRPCYPATLIKAAGRHRTDREGPT